MKILFNLPYLHCFVFLCGWLTLDAGAMEWNINDYPLDQRKLANYDIQTFEKQFSTPDSEGQTKGLMGVLLIDAPYDQVWSVISDWEAQGDFVPGLDYFRVKHVFPAADEQHWRALIEGKLDIPFVSFRYTLDAHFDKTKGTMRWAMLRDEELKAFQDADIPVRASDEDRLRDIQGFGQIKAFSDQQTVYYYAPIVEVNVSIPGFVENMIKKVSLSQYLHAIKDQAERLHQQR